MYKVLIGFIGLVLVFVACQHSEVWQYVEYCYPNWTPDGKIICLEKDRKFKVLKLDLIGGEESWFLEIEYKLLEVDKEGGSCRQIAFVAKAKGSETYEEDYSSGELYYLNNEVGHPNLSCSSNRIVFSVWGKEYEKYEMWIINRDGSGLKKLSDKGTYPDLSPDGKRVVYEKPGEGIWIMNADGTGDHQITTGSQDVSPSWSPTGNKIAFIDQSLGQVCIIDTNGQNKTPLTAGLEYTDWSWDGSKVIFFDSIFDIDSMRVIGPNPMSTGCPKFSPDGTMFVGGGVFTINVDGTNRKRILTDRAFIESKGLW